MKRLLSLMAASALLACGTQRLDLGSSDAGPDCITRPCDCCAQGQVCVDGACCTPRCEGKQCGSDGCGGSCGDCETGWTCNDGTGSCECSASETDEAFCARLGRVCGAASGKDGCGRDREVASCGSCAAGWVCDTADGQCACPGESDGDFCARVGVACGKASGADLCGTPRTVDCDRCVRPETCDAASGTCRCAGEESAALCQQLEMECGAVAVRDQCGAARTLDCGECGPGFSCGEANTCVVCVDEPVPQFCRRLGAECGTASGADNCREQRTVDCGGCQPGFQCEQASNTCVVCVAESDAELCAAQGNLTCGAVSGVDRCGLPRTVDCGACTGTDWCDATHHCAPCVPETDAVLCANNHIECGPLAAADRCGDARAVAECGPCGALERCEATAGTCVLCTPETDAELCAFWFYTCGSPPLVDRCGQPRIPTCGPSCPSGLSCQSTFVCGDGIVPTNDTCDTPERLVLDAAGNATVSGDLTDATDNYVGSCGGSGRDVVYVVRLAQPTNLRLALTSNGYLSWPAVYLRSTCTSVSDLACANGASAPHDATLTARALVAGDYFIVVDNYAAMAQEGPFTLTASATPTRPAPANDTCAAPEDLVFTGAVATASGDTSDAFDDFSGACGGGVLNGSDLVYRMTLTSDAAVSVTVTSGSGSYYPALQVLSACPGAGGSSPIACATQTSGVASLRLGVLLAGDYYLIVDGTSASYGPFTLQVTTSAPVYNDVCSGASDIALAPVVASTDLAGTVAGDTSVATDDYTSSCNPSTTGPDLVYQFTLTTPKSVKLDLVPGPGSLAKPNLGLRTGCAPAGLEKSCAYSDTAGAAVSLRFNQLEAGTYYAFVDGRAGTSGPFSLTVTASEPPPTPLNDTCARATPLSLVNGWAHVEGSTGDAFDDYAGSCSTGVPFTGPDVTYSVTTPATGTVVAKLRRNANSPTYRPAVYIQSLCGDASTDLGCGYSASASEKLAQAATATGLAAGTYYVVVDGVDASWGDFALDVLFYSSAGPDTCGQAKRLSFDGNGDAAEVGDTCLLNPDASNSVTSTCSFANTSGHDAVYELVTTRAQNLRVEFEPGQNFGSYVYLQTTCGNSNTQIACNEATGGATNSLLTKNLAAGTYYIWLDNDASVDCGTYLARFHLSDPPPAPANDKCAGAQAMAFDPATGTAAATGTTESAAHDTAGSCSSSTPGGGPDVFYSFTIPTSSSVDVQVTPTVGSDLQPIIYLQTSCGNAITEKQCAASSGAGQSAALHWPRLGAGTYYLVVDSYDPNATGPFTVSISTGPAGPAASNDLCANAVAMSAIDSVTKKTSITGDTFDGNDDDTSGCSSRTAVFSGADLAYSFVLPVDSLVTAKVTRASSAVYKPALSIRRSCALSDEVACGNDSSTGPTGIAQVTRALTAGTWYVIVDGLDSTFGPFTLEVTQGAAAVAADSCGNAVALTFSGNSATASGDLRTSGLTNDYADTVCATTSHAGGPDVVYSFTTTSDKLVTVAMAPGATGGTSLRPYVYLRSACNDPSSETACAYASSAGSTIRFVTGRLPAGTYYLVLDSYSSSYAGTYVLTVTLADPVNPPPSNETCRTATPLVLVDNEAHLTGDTRDASDDSGGTGVCGVNNTAVNRLFGGDVVYAVAVAQGSTLTASVKASATTASYVPAIYLRANSNCASSSASDQLACDYQTSTSYRLAGVSATNLAAGTYYLVVDGKDGTSGLFNLDVYVRPAPISNVSCATAAPIVFDTSVPGQAVATIVGDTTLGANLTAGIQQGSQACSSTGKELYYSFTTMIVQDLVVQTTPLNAAYQPTVYLRSDCADPGSQVVCNFNSGGAPLNLTKLKLPAGSYTLIVDGGYTSYNGPFSMQVKLSDRPAPPANDLCLGALPLTLPASGNAAGLTFSDSTVAANNEYVGGCQTGSYPFDGPEVVYQLTPTTNTQVTAKVVAKPTSLLKAAIYLRSTCEAVGDDVCKYNTTAGSATGATVVASVKAATTYYLFVDGVGGSAGDFDVTITVDDTKYLDGDACTNAVSLDTLFAPNPTDPNELIATVNGDSSIASNDYDCSLSTYNGGDIAYSFTLTQESVVAVTVGPNGASSRFAALLSVRGTCGDARSELNAVTTYAQQTPMSIRLTRLPPGRYFVIADGSSSAASYNGPFTLTVSVKPPPISTAVNDTCGGATSLTFGPGTGTSQVATITGEDSSYAADDAQGSCYNSHGADLVYTFTTTGAQSFKAEVRPDAGQALFKPVVYLRSVCNQSADAAELGCVAQTTGGAAATLTVNSIPAGTYWLYVDNFLANQWDPPGGKYTLVVTLDAVAPVAPPANDSCPGAQAITLTGQAPSLTTLTGQTTLGASNDTYGKDASCYSGYGTSGPDVVYYFDLTNPAKVDAKATFSTSGAYPVVYLRASCSRGTVACAFSSSANNATASAPYLTPGRYYLWVDSYNANGSNFQLDLTLSVPSATTPPSNTFCSGTLPALTLGVAVNGTTVGAVNANTFLGIACGTSNSGGGPNVVYTYTPSQTGFFSVTLFTKSVSGTGSDLFVWMSDRCLDGAACLAYNNGASGALTTDFFRFYGKANVTYYIVVDANSATYSGSFTLTVN